VVSQTKPRRAKWRVHSALCVLVVGIALPLSATPHASDSVERSGYLAVDGARLFLTTRGTDRRAPVLLWLHGGPGGAERPLFRYFNDDLEKHFVVAYWDQRGAGRSFDPNADPHRLTIARHLADLDAVVDHLRQSLEHHKIVLVGHSWGTALGLLYARDHPEKVSAFIGVAQLVSTVAQQHAQYDYVLAEASRHKDERVLSRLRTIGPPPHEKAARVLAMETLADGYGGVYHKRPNRLWVMVEGVARGLVTPWEIPRFIRGNNISLDAMNDELLALDLSRSVPSVQVPVFFFLGRYDRHAEAALAAAYFEALRAPVKKLIWFENSAHNIPFEEPDRFDAEVVGALQSIGIGGGS
jgi:proline iminopeptidase